VESKAITTDGTNRTDLDERIADLVYQVRSAQQQIESLQAEIDGAKAVLQILLRQRGENWSDDTGYARLLSEAVRIGYDTHALDDLIINDPLRYGWLKDYRIESAVRGGVQVK